MVLTLPYTKFNGFQNSEYYGSDLPLLTLPLFSLRCTLKPVATQSSVLCLSRPSSFQCVALLQLELELIHCLGQLLHSLFQLLHFIPQALNLLGKAERGRTDGRTDVFQMYST